MCRSGMPKDLTTDSGTQFNSFTVKGFCEMYNIKIIFAPMYHPQANGIAKAIVANMRKNLEEKKGNWLEELPKVLWV